MSADFSINFTIVGVARKPIKRIKKKRAIIFIIIKLTKNNQQKIKKVVK
ncbi:hypothetical protein RCH33_2834 [Flavobacterium daejeonense]|nr:hypothetical protein RCH33_2834 [Flavobacterium daejeonense]